MRNAFYIVAFSMLVIFVTREIILSEIEDYMEEKMSIVLAEKAQNDPE